MLKFIFSILHVARYFKPLSRQIWHFVLVFAMTLQLAFAPAQAQNIEDTSGAVAIQMSPESPKDEIYFDHGDIYPAELAKKLQEGYRIDQNKNKDTYVFITTNFFQKLKQDPRIVWNAITYAGQVVGYWLKMSPFALKQIYLNLVGKNFSEFKLVNTIIGTLSTGTSYSIGLMKDSAHDYFKLLVSFPILAAVAAVYRYHFDTLVAAVHYHTRTNLLQGLTEVPFALQEDGLSFKNLKEDLSAVRSVLRYNWQELKNEIIRNKQYASNKEKYGQEIANNLDVQEAGGVEQFFKMYLLNSGFVVALSAVSGLTGGYAGQSIFKILGNMAATSFGATLLGNYDLIIAHEIEKRTRGASEEDAQKIKSRAGQISIGLNFVENLMIVAAIKGSFPALLTLTLAGVGINLYHFGIAPRIPELRARFRRTQSCEKIFLGF